MQTDDSAPKDRATAAEPSPPRTGHSRRAALISTIEGEMVPRLLMLRRTTGSEQSGASSADKATEPGDVEELARLLVAHGPEIAWAFVEAAHLRGVSYDRICVGLLAPAARRLAEQWEHRDVGKSELTLGLDGLRTVLLEIGNAAKNERHTSRER
jgi:hypothetical protein